ncbi:hypothetical protein RHS02_05526, partial [Rhizoctonia solani]
MILQLRNDHSVPKKGERLIVWLDTVYKELAIVVQSNWLGPVPAAPEHMFVHGLSIIEIGSVVLPLEDPVLGLLGREKVVTTISGKPGTGMRFIEPTKSNGRGSLSTRWSWCGSDVVPMAAADTCQQFNKPTRITQAGISSHTGDREARVNGALIRQRER